VTEFLAEFVRGPAMGLGIAFLLGDFDKRAMPEVLFGAFLSVAVADGAGQARPEFDKLAVALDNFGRGVNLGAARRAISRLWRQDATAVGTKFDGRDADLIVLVVSLAGFPVVELAATTMPRRW
jgi:hypothetical protein